MPIDVTSSGWAVTGRSRRREGAATVNPEAVRDTFTADRQRLQEVAASPGQAVCAVPSIV